jgi:hypothetical protein
MEKAQLRMEQTQFGFYTKMLDKVDSYFNMFAHFLNPIQESQA